MTLTDEVLTTQQARIHRARRIAHHADQCRDIGIGHARQRALAPLEASCIERFLAAAAHHGYKASRAFALARRLYDRSANVLRGIA